MAGYATCVSACGVWVGAPEAMRTPENSNFQRTTENIMNGVWSHVWGYIWCCVWMVVVDRNPSGGSQVYCRQVYFRQLSSPNNRVRINRLADTTRAHRPLPPSNTTREKEREGERERERDRERE